MDNQSSTSSAWERRLTMQGFSCSTESGVSEIRFWLRFTPALSTIWIGVGTVLASPFILWFFSAVSLLGAVSKFHIFDRVYNSWLQRLTKTPALQPNPKPRRFSMLLASIWSAVSGMLFMSGYINSGYISGALLFCAGALVATTHFCLGSWVYRILEPLMRRKVRLS